MFLSEKEKEDLKDLPLLKSKATPRDENWQERLKEELFCLIKYVKKNKERDQEFFKIKPKDKTGISWEGKCWYYFERKKYEFHLEFDLDVNYPKTCVDFRLPELIGKTKKMYETGIICQTIHFKPYWKKNVPNLGIAHALKLGLAPWLSAEVPILISKGKI